MGKQSYVYAGLFKVSTPALRVLVPAQGRMGLTVNKEGEIQGGGVVLTCVRQLNSLISPLHEARNSFSLSAFDLRVFSMSYEDL